LPVNRKRTVPGTVKPGPTPEMLRAAAAAHLSGQGIVLYGRAYDLIAGDLDDAADWLTEQVVCVLNELSTGLSGGLDTWDF
jgi:hypothetical protein